MDKTLRRANIIKHFRTLWEKLFSSPIHLDSALSDVPPLYRSAVYQLTTAVLQRPHSIARYLRLKISSDEPWFVSRDQMPYWNFAAVAADRLWGSLLRDPKLLESDLVQAQDFPPYLQEAFVKAVGKSGAETMGRALVQPPHVVLRVKRELPLDEFLLAMRQSDVLPHNARPSTISPTGVVIPQFARVRQSKEFEKGFYEIQDDGSQFLAYFSLWPELYGPLLSQKPGKAPTKTFPLPPPPTKNFIAIDACAGAGGKTLALADALGGKGRVYAYDVSARKLLSLRQRARRADYHNVQTLAITEATAAESLKKFEGTADMVLVDAPCSGWGVLRRNPDIKWRQTDEELERLPQLQLRLLTLYSSLVKPGGTLTYGICSFREEESHGVIEKFKKSHPEFKLGKHGFLGPIGCDGFFMASFTRGK